MINDTNGNGFERSPTPRAPIASRYSKARMALAAMAVSGCASAPPVDGPPTEAEMLECEALGGSFERIHALDTWACALPLPNGGEAPSSPPGY